VIGALAPAFGGQLPWDEASDAAPWFERVDETSLDALYEHVATIAGGSKLRRWLASSRGDDGAAHLLGTIFVPVETGAPAQIDTPINGIIASIPESLRQLERTLPEAAQPACRSLRAALSAARELHLPMIVDA
jgi:hypothetical protein